MQVSTFKKKVKIGEYRQHDLYNFINMLASMINPSLSKQKTLFYFVYTEINFKVLHQ